MLLIDHIYKKQRTVDQLPRKGKRIPLGDENFWLGEFISAFPGGYQLWRLRHGLFSGYSVFDPDSRKVDLYLSGTRFIHNSRSLRIYGIYARPNNCVRAIQLYEFLIKKLNLILISDKMQSPGGQKIWKQLHRKKSIIVYGWNFKSDTYVDISNNKFKEIYITNKQIEKAQPGKIQNLKGQASNVRLVACAA